MLEKVRILQSAMFLLVLTGLAALLLPGPASSKSPQTESLSPFSIVVKTNDAGFDLTCRQGCAWERLTFTPPADGSAQAIDQWGMTTLQSRDRDSDEHRDLASFLFTISESDDRISLMGFEGTAWVTLGFTCPKSGCNQGIDERGTSNSRRR